MSNTQLARPPYDPELVGAVGPFPSAVTDAASFQAFRESPALGLAELEPLFRQHRLEYSEVVAPGPRGDVILGVLRPAGTAGEALPVLYDIHGGGMVFGDRFTSFMPEVLEWSAEFRMVIVSPEYGLAPEVPAPGGALDCFAGLKWVAEHADELGIDASRIIVGGASGGGGLAASVGLLARDHSGPSLLAQMLLCPQLEDRHQTVSSRQFSAETGAIDPWPRETNAFAWEQLLGAGHAEREVDIYSSPARATDLSGLAQTYIDCGGNEVFRDADVAYASLLWESGVSTELHVWPGGFHGFDMLSPAAPVSHDARAARVKWLRRVLDAAAPAAG